MVLIEARTLWHRLQKWICERSEEKLTVCVLRRRSCAALAELSPAGTEAPAGTAGMRPRAPRGARLQQEPQSKRLTAPRCHANEVGMDLSFWPRGEEKEWSISLMYSSARPQLSLNA